MNLDLAVWITGIGAEATVALLLFRGNIYKRFPVFCAYLLWTVVSDATMMVLGHRLTLANPRYTQLYILEMSVDSVIQFGVLVELAWSVLRPIRASLPRVTLFAIAALVLVLGAAIWPLTGQFDLKGLTPQWHTMMRLQQTFSFLRILFFIGMAAFSQLLAISWRDRELQIATGLGFYSLASLGATMLHTHHASAAFYHEVDLFVSVSYLGSLLYWILSFLQPEAARQEFTPRMQNILLTVSGAARTHRIALDKLGKPVKR